MSPIDADKLPKKRMRFAKRKLDPGMGKAVARRTYLRKVTDQETGRERWEDWQEVADRVALGNSLLTKNFKGLGDVGVISSDGNGRINVARTCWSNKDTNLVSDEPMESWLYPAKWGRFHFE